MGQAARTGAGAGPETSGAADPTGAAVPGGSDGSPGSADRHDVRPGGLPPLAWRPRQYRLLLLAGAALLLLWLAQSVLGPFVVAGLLAYAFSPIVRAAERRTGLPRVAVVGLGYLAALAVLGAGLWAVAGRLTAELQEFTTGGSDALTADLVTLLGGSTLHLGNQQVGVAEIAGQLERAAAGLLGSPTSALQLAQRVADTGLQFFLVAVVTFYFLLDGERVGMYLLRPLAPEQRDQATTAAGRIHDVLGRWLRGQLFLIALVSIVAYIALGPVLHVPYALLLGLMTGLLEILPLVGPVVAASIAALAGLAHGGPVVAGLVIAIYAVVRVVEDQLVMPVVIGRAVHLHPVVTLFAVLVGLANWGILGGLLGVPAAAALNVTLSELGLDRPPEPAGR